MLSSKPLYNFCMKWRHTTLLAITSPEKSVLFADGQVSLGPTIVKSNANKIHTLNPSLHIGFAGSLSDAHYLIHSLSAYIQQYSDPLKAAIEFSM